MKGKNSIQIRREKVAQCLAKSITSKSDISDILKIPYSTVDNDIRWLRSLTQPWLFGMAQDGFAFDCKMVIDKLARIERRYETIAEELAKDKDVKTRWLEIAVLEKLANVSVQRLNVESKGPTLMLLRKVIKGDFKEEDKVEPEA